MNRKKEQQAGLYGLIFFAGSAIGAIGYGERLPGQLSLILFILGPLVCIVSAVLLIRLLVKDR